MKENQLFIETCEQLLREQTPNLMRLYLNPYVAQTCFCLERYVQSTWFVGSHPAEPFQSFLANGFDEAVSGAVKLARYVARVAQRPVTGLVIDTAGRLGMFASSLSRRQRVEFLPGLVVIGKDDMIPLDQQFGFVVLTSGVEE
ncbi:MAG TPA: hypothetical protein VE988_08440, partial [Gemmataceae bacterium]|nr:hypothetical protein [Gemmataceae bacterium]